MMAMKPKRLYYFAHRAVTVSLPFKWQWRVVWTVPGNRGLNASGAFPSRAHARGYKQALPPHWKARIQRRLVQCDWSEYADTFSYNAKGNGNGR